MNISESLKSNSQPVTSEISEKNLPAEKIENLSVVDKSESLCQQAFKLFASQSTRNFFVPIRGELPDGIFWDDATEQERQWATEDAAKRRGRERNPLSSSFPSQLPLPCRIVCSIHLER